MKRETLDAVLAARASKRACALVTNLKSGIQNIFYLYEKNTTYGIDSTTIHAALRADRSGPIEAPDGSYFVQVFNPPSRLILVGAVHIAQTLAPMAAQADYAVSVIDPRRSFASDARFPNVELSTEWPDEAMARLKPDSRTAV
ncbi:MAG: xanthine dehydrogenase, partial [Alphaproteobacteria bacterium]|nr:xanthine dehydrogenase [Alphaproteobacteria bacterium]